MSVAAVLFNKIPVEGRSVVCLVSGGNIDVTILSRVISRGLLKAGRSADITIELLDKPGQLSGVSDIIARAGGTSCRLSRPGRLGHRHQRLLSAPGDGNPGS